MVVQSVYIYKRFNEPAIEEVLRHGIIAQLPKDKLTQMEYTAPKMFEYFNVDRLALFRQHRARSEVMHQVETGHDCYCHCCCRVHETISLYNTPE